MKTPFCLTSIAKITFALVVICMLSVTLTNCSKTEEEQDNFTYTNTLSIEGQDVQVSAVEYYDPFPRKDMISLDLVYGDKYEVMIYIPTVKTDGREIDLSVPEQDLIGLAWTVSVKERGKDDREIYGDGVNSTNNQLPKGSTLRIKRSGSEFRMRFYFIKQTNNGQKIIQGNYKGEAEAKTP